MCRAAEKAVEAVGQRKAQRDIHDLRHKGGAVDKLRQYQIACRADSAPLFAAGDIPPKEEGGEDPGAHGSGIDQCDEMQGPAGRGGQKGRRDQQAVKDLLKAAGSIVDGQTVPGDQAFGGHVIPCFIRIDDDRFQVIGDQKTDQNRKRECRPQV